MKKMPQHKPGESKDDWMKRCVPYIIKKEGKTQKEAIGKCSGMYDDWKKKQKNEESDMKKDRIHLYLNATRLNTFLKAGDESEDPKLGIQRTTILVGDKSYNGVYFPKEEIEKSISLWNGKDFLYDHSSSVYDLIGDINETQYDKLSGKLSVLPDINGYPLSDSAIRSITTLQNKGKIPNVSVGVYVSRKWLSDKEIEEGNYPKGTFSVAEDLDPEHLALVIHGACDPDDGCGIGMSNNEHVTILFEDYVDKKELYKKLEKEILKERIKLEGGRSK